MLLSLKVSNLATIESLDVEFAQGFTILTGETGAGKSIIIDAIHLLLGDKASQDLVRTGKEIASVEAVFDIQQLPLVQVQLHEMGIPFETELIIRGVIKQNGRQRSYLNDMMVSRAKLIEVGRHLIDIHGQHDNQTLLQSSSHLFFLDGFGQLISDTQHVQFLFQTYQKQAKSLKSLKDQLQERQQRIEFLQFQQQEIQKAELEPNEEHTLDAEAQKLSYAERLSYLVSQSQELLHEQDQSLIAGIQHLQPLLKEVEKADPEASLFTQQLESVLFQLEDLHQQLSQYANRIQPDPERLEWVNQRLSHLQQLKRKYGESIEAIFEHLETLEQELERLNSLEQQKLELEQEHQETMQRLQTACDKLSKKRQTIAKSFDREVMQQLHEMGMEKAVFQTQIHQRQSEDPKDVYKATGIDEIEFLLSVNPGQGLKSLIKVASGGELSRIMLALKTVLGAVDPAESMVFDEIDTGISGRIAEIVGHKLQQLGQSRQVLCITHLPQIAALAESHFVIKKTVDGNQTFTHICPLNEQEHIHEVARLMGGTEITENTVQLAQEMVARAEMV